MKTSFVYHLTGLAIAIPICLLFWQLFSYAVDRVEIVECLKLERYSIEFAPHFTMTDYESAMCKSHGFDIQTFNPSYESE